MRAGGDRDLAEAVRVDGQAARVEEGSTREAVQADGDGEPLGKEAPVRIACIYIYIYIYSLYALG